MPVPDFIAEVSSNHNRDLGRMKEFIDVAADIGCSGIKYQLFKLDELFAPEILERSEEHRRRREWELPVEFIPELSQHAHGKGLKFSCTPFYLEAVEILRPHVDFFKIASYELLWLDLFKACAETGLPVVFSTGMATLEEVSSATGCLVDQGCESITVLHCNSAYPTPVEDANLSGIDHLRQQLKGYAGSTNMEFGWSDHTVSPGVIHRAVNKYGSSMIEFHLDLEGEGAEYVSEHCWLPDQIGEVIRDVKSGFAADGDSEYRISKTERPDREWRADPQDGLRPMKHVRDTFGK